MATVDEKILLWLNSWVGHFEPLDIFVQALNSDYLVPTFFSLVLLGLWFWGRDSQQRAPYQRAVMAGMISLGFASLAVFVINQHYVRPRPFTEYELSLLFYRPTDPSFPANSAAVAFAMATAVWLVSRRLGVVLLIVAAMHAFSRVYAGVFYPSDVVAGGAIGVVVSLLVFTVLRLIEPIPTLVLKLGRSVYLA